MVHDLRLETDGMTRCTGKDIVQMVADLTCCNVEHLMQVLASAKEAMPESQADEYLEKWGNAEEVRERCIVLEHHFFRYAKYSRFTSNYVWYC